MGENAEISLQEQNPKSTTLKLVRRISAHLKRKLRESLTRNGSRHMINKQPVIAAWCLKMGVQNEFWLINYLHASSTL
jgi:hypothetical protein